MLLGKTQQPGSKKPPLIHAVDSAKLSRAERWAKRIYPNPLMQCVWICGNISSRGDVFEGDPEDITCPRCKEKVK